MHRFIHYASISLHFVLWTFLCGLAERWDFVLLQAHHSAHGMRISALCRSVFGAFRIIILLQNERLLIAFLVRLIYHTFLLHYCAIHLKEMYFKFTVYIYTFTYKYITCFSWMYFKTIQTAMYIILHYHFRFSPTLIPFYFICKNVFSPTNFRFYKIVHSWFF